MVNRLKLYGSALLISFAGSLPIGTLNVSITNLVINKNIAGAILFGIGAILVEVALVRIALVVVRRLEGMTRLEGIPRLLQGFRMIACIVIFLFAFLSLDAAWHMQKAGVAIPFTGDAPFVSGLVLSLLNPLHLPFWMGWTAMLRTKGLLADTRKDYNLYVPAIGTGTTLAFLSYGIAGHLLILFLQKNQYLFNWLTGLALLATGGIQLWKFYRSSEAR